MRIDSHQHFWNYSAKEYPWITEKLKSIARDFLPQDLERELQKVKLDGCIAVQARQTLEESRWLLNLADHYPLVKGVVGWVDLRTPKVEEQLSEFAKHPRFVAVRHVVQDEPDDRFMLQPDFLRGIGKLKQFNLAYDVLIFPKQLAAAIELAKRFPVKSPWDAQIRELAKQPNVFCKVSGMVTEAKWNAWKVEDYYPYLDVVFEAFGADRLLYGSDWPVCLLSASYQRVYDLTHDYVLKNAPKAEAKIFGENAAKAYRLKA
jgi:L-fuconolactonase